MPDLTTPTGPLALLVDGEESIVFSSCDPTGRCAEEFGIIDKIAGSQRILSDSGNAASPGNSGVRQLFEGAGAEAIEERDIRPFHGSTPCRDVKSKMYAILSFPLLVRCARKLAILRALDGILATNDLRYTSEIV